MITAELTAFYEDRLDEIIEYVDLLSEVEKAARSGAPRIQGATTAITTSQQRILYSSVYLQLYNLVEATVSQCVEAISKAATSGNWRPSDLSAEIRREWVRYSARTHILLTPEKRLSSAVDMCDHLVDSLPLTAFQIEQGGGGNWDDEAIEEMSARLGCTLEIDPRTRTSVKRLMRDGVGALKLVKVRRNALAHGEISFSECADGVTVSEIRTVVGAVSQYLREAVSCFVSFVDLFDFLLPERRPSGGNAS